MYLLPLSGVGTAAVILLASVGLSWLRGGRDVTLGTLVTAAIGAFVTMALFTVLGGMAMLLGAALDAKDLDALSSALITGFFTIAPIDQVSAGPDMRETAAEVGTGLAVAGLVAAIIASQAGIWLARRRALDERAEEAVEVLGAFFFAIAALTTASRALSSFALWAGNEAYPFPLALGLLAAFYGLAGGAYGWRIARRLPAI